MKQQRSEADLPKLERLHEHAGNEGSLHATDTCGPLRVQSTAYSFQQATRITAHLDAESYERFLGAMISTHVEVHPPLDHPDADPTPWAALRVTVEDRDGNEYEVSTYLSLDALRQLHEDLTAALVTA